MGIGEASTGEHHDSRPLSPISLLKTRYESDSVPQVILGWLALIAVAALVLFLLSRITERESIAIDPSANRIYSVSHTFWFFRTNERELKWMATTDSDNLPAWHIKEKRGWEPVLFSGPDTEPLEYSRE